MLLLLNVVCYLRYTQYVMQVCTVNYVFIVNSFAQSDSCFWHAQNKVHGSLDLLKIHLIELHGLALVQLHLISFKTPGGGSKWFIGYSSNWLEAFCFAYTISPIFTRIRSWWVWIQCMSPYQCLIVSMSYVISETLSCWGQCPTNFLLSW